MKNICLIANHDLTYFYHEIALQLQNKEVNIFWITPSPKQYKWLCEKYTEKKVLLIDLDTPKNESIGDFNVNELLYSDRTLKFNKEKGYEYLINIQRPIYDFIESNILSYVFGETTWSFEVLIHRIVTRKEELNCKFLSFTGIRIPTGRFSFFEDEKMNKIFELSESKNEIISTDIKIETPDYLKRNDFSLKKKNSILGLFLRLWNLITFKNVDKGNPCRPKVIHTIRLKIREFLNRRYYYSLKTNSIKDIQDPFVFVTLHQQPESSVDIVGMYYEDQKQNIINLWRKLPLGWKLVVKEHSNSVGCRGKSFFESLIDLPNLILVDEKEKAIDFIKKCKLVVSVSGTVNLEALLMGEISFLFGKPHFSGYEQCYNITLSDIKNCDNLSTLIEKKKLIIQPSKEILNKFILKNSIKAVISNPVSNPMCMTDDNIRESSKAIYNVIRK